jgi:hypothetical protein
VLGILDQGQTQAPATKSDLDQWEGAFGQNFPIMLGTSDTENLMMGYGFEVVSPRPRDMHRS